MKTLLKLQDETGSVKRRLISFSIAFALLMIFFACSNDEPGPDAEDNEVTQADAYEDLYGEDAEDLAFHALTNEELEEGKSATGDERFSCATVTRSGTQESGIITIDFGDGCEDLRGRVRKGVIVITYEGRWSIPGAFWQVDFDDYSINDIDIRGTRLVTNVSETDDVLAFEVVLEDGSMTFPDGRTATRKVNRRREHERDENNVLKRLIIYGTAEGNNRNGRGYQIEILERLIYDRDCAAQGVIIPVSGVKLIKHGQREITVDYGDGTCDNIVTITNKNGRSWRFTIE